MQSHLEHDLGELLLVVLPELPENDPAELGEVDVAALGDLVGDVDDLLLGGVQAQHLHRLVQVLGRAGRRGGKENLRVDGRLSKTRLETSEDGGDVLQLLVRQQVGVVGHVGADAHLGQGGGTSDWWTLNHGTYRTKLDM